MKGFVKKNLQYQLGYLFLQHLKLYLTNPCHMYRSLILQRVFLLPMCPAVGWTWQAHNIFIFSSLDDTYLNNLSSYIHSLNCYKSLKILTSCFVLPWMYIVELSILHNKPLGFFSALPSSCFHVHHQDSYWFLVL